MRAASPNLPLERCEGDILDQESLAAAAKGRTVIFHAAAVFSYWGMSAEEQRHLAERGTRNVLEAAQTRRVKRVVVTSSSVVLGSTVGKQVLDEDNPLDEPDPSAYTRSKIGQEAAAFKKGEELGVDVVAVLPTLVVGGFDYRLSPSNANVVNYLNDPFRSTFIGGCNIVSAGDVADGHILAAQRGKAGARYVLGSENLGWPDVHGLISELAGTFFSARRWLSITPRAAYLGRGRCRGLSATDGNPADGHSGRSQRCRAAATTGIATNASPSWVTSPVSARQALAEAIAWLWVRSYISDAVMEKLKLSREVRSARERFTRQLAS